MEAGADAAVSDVLLPGTIGVAAAALAIAASLAVAMLLGARWRRREPLVPPRPAEPVVWNGADVAWVVAVAIFLVAGIFAVIWVRSHGDQVTSDMHQKME